MDIRQEGTGSKEYTTLPDETFSAIGKKTPSYFQTFSPNDNRFILLFRSIHPSRAEMSVSLSSHTGGKLPERLDE
jgi:hypothetical protein